MGSIPGKVIAPRSPARHDGAMSSDSAAQIPAFGRQLKHWRRQQGLSQLALASAADLSQRHLSFIETGRSRPGEDVVLRVAEALDLPLRERNNLLLAAGLTPCFADLPLSHDAIAPFRAAIERMLETHEPYPAYVIDRWWDVVDANAAGWRLFPVARDGPVNAVDVFLAPGPVRDMVENFDAVAWAFLQRLRLEIAGSGPDARLQALLERAEGYLKDLPPPASNTSEPGSELVICPRLRVGDQTVATLSMIARFGNTREVNLDELRVEMLFPADAAAVAFFHGLAEAAREEV